MSELVKLVYDTSRIRSRYRHIHNRVMGFSLRAMRLLVRPDSAPELSGYEKELQALDEYLNTVEGALQRLDPKELTKREGNELRTGLLEYVEALGASIDRLLRICAGKRKEQEGDPEFARYSDTQYADDRVAYDDAIQHHRRLGARLNELTARI